MGILKFISPPTTCLPNGAISQAYLTGLDRIPWLGEVEITDEGFSVSHQRAESGLLHLAWRVEGEGAPILSTGSLMARDRPYLLPLEIARGTLHRLRNHIACLEQSGMELSPALYELVQESQRRFMLAATSQEEQQIAASEAEQSIAISMAAIQRLMKESTSSILDTDKKKGERNSSLLVVNVGGSLPEQQQMEALADAFPVAAIDFNWASIEPVAGSQQWQRMHDQVEMLAAANMRICGGPLFQLSKERLPSWLFQGEKNYEAIEAFARHYVEAALSQFRGKISLWHAIAGIRESGLLDLSVEEEMRLIVALIETVRMVDPTTPLFVSFAQPWAESMAKKSSLMPPLYLADALARAGLGLTAIGLEIDLSGEPETSQPRDLLEIHRQMDHWSAIGLPLVILLSAPEAIASPDQIDAIVSLLLSKKGVQVIGWNRCFTDQALPHPAMGLFDEKGNPAPLLKIFERLQKTYITPAS